MESREAFKKRIYDYFPKEFFLEKKFFETRQSVKDKVDSTNHFKDFYGDTIVFDLGLNYKNRINSIISELYNYVPECFCERLSKDNLHITLHDLSSSKRIEDVSSLLHVNQIRLNQILNTVKIMPQTIRMKTHCIANILNISLVLVFVPINNEEYLKLITLYRLFDGVRTLDYYYSPHVTLGYYNINGFDVSSVEKLENLVKKLNEEEFEITISTEKLFYQIFTSMDEYTNILNLSI